MHTLLDLHGNIPTFISITDGKVHDVNVLDEFLPEAGAFYVMDRGYVDFERRYSHPVDKMTRRSLRSHRHSHHRRLGESVPGRATARKLSRCGNAEAV
jgi:hypothetical protein